MVSTASSSTSSSGPLTQSVETPLTPNATPVVTPIAAPKSSQRVQTPNPPFQPSYPSFPQNPNPTNPLQFQPFYPSNPTYFQPYYPSNFPRPSAPYPQFFPPQTFPVHTPAPPHNPALFTPNPYPTLPQPLAFKLNDNNFLLWKNQLLNAVLANGLHGFLDGSIPAPSKFLDDNHIQPNPDFVSWERYIVL